MMSSSSSMMMTSLLYSTTTRSRRSMISTSSSPPLSLMSSSFFSTSISTNKNREGYNNKRTTRPKKKALLPSSSSSSSFSRRRRPVSSEKSPRKQQHQQRNVNSKYNSSSSSSSSSYYENLYKNKNNRGNRNKKFDNTKNSHFGASTSSNTDIVKWDDEHNQRSRNKNRSAPYNNRSSTSSSSSSSYYNTNTDTNFQLKRFREKEKEFCNILNEYHNCWYPTTTKSVNNNNNNNNDNNNNAKKVITTFQHPDLASPWTTWDTVMESEELFRHVCTSNHELFVACASLLTEQSDNVNDNQYCNFNYNNNSNNNNNDEYLRESRAYLIDTATTTTTNNNNSNKEKVYWNNNTNNNNDNNPNIRLRSDCEELLRTILPFWETIRRERSILVDRCRPPPSNSSMNTHIIENNKKGEDTNNDWMGWLRTVVTGNESSSSSSSSSSVVVGDGVDSHGNINSSNNITSGVVTAHLDPEYAPNQFHYTKLVGRLYFHYLPLELFHKRFRPYSNNRTAFNNTDGDDNDNDNDGEVNKDSSTGNDDTVDDDDNFNYKNDHLPSYSAWEQKRGEILQQRAEQIQYVVDQSSYNNGISTESNIDNNININNNNNIVLTDKIIRLLVRSYRDMSTLEAAQQAERVYNGHPHHQKGLLWYVLMCYLKTITQYTAHDRPGENYKDRKLRYYKDAAIAAERICKLFFSKHSMSKHWKDSRGELYNCSIVAFEALARLPDRHHLRGYYERVHSLGIVKFGPKAWEALISTTHKVNGPDRLDLSQALHAKDYKVLNFLIQIYSNDGEYLDRALRLLDVSFDVYSTHDLQESLEQSTFQKLIKRLRKKSWKRINNMKSNKEKDAVKLGGKTSRCSYDSNSNKNISELDTVFRLLDKMILHEKWFPDRETFNYLFPMAIYGDNPGPDAESIRAKLEACRFLASMSSSSIPNTAGVDSVTFSSNTVPDLYSPIKASNRTLNAWLQTVDKNEGVVPPREPNPAERAWEILRALRVGSSPLFLPIEKGIPRSLYDPDHIPDEILYTLALKVCSRVNNSSKPLDVALDIFDVVQKEGILLEGSICLNLIRVISNSTNLIRRVEYTKIVYLAIIEENPNFDDTKPELAQQLKKQFSYFRTRHPELYELHLAELKFESTYPQDATTTESGDDDDDDDDDDLRTTKL